MSLYLTEFISTFIVADQASASGAFQIERWVRYIGVLLPDIDAAVVTLTVCATLAGTYYPVMDLADGEDWVLLASGQDPAFVDITKFIISVPSTWYFKLAFGAAQNGGPYTFSLVQRG
jgi:hypothetical protein